MRREREMMVERCVARLPRRLKEAVILRFHQDLSYAEMSEILGRSETALRTRIFKALGRLRKCMRGHRP